MIIELEKLTIRNLLKNSYTRHGQSASIAYVGEVFLTYEQLERRVMEIALDLHQRGVRQGDCIAILGENSPNWVIAYLAITSMGCTAVPILTGFPDSDARHILRQTEAVAIFVSEKQQSKLFGAKNTCIKTIYSLEDFSIAEKVSLASLEANLNFVQRHQSGPDIKNIEKDLPLPEEEDLATIIYTSGTTGHSKGVMLTHRNIVYDVIHSIERFPIDHNDRFLSILPLAHTFEATGGMLCPMAVGASISYMQGLPTPQKLLNAMQTVRPTAVLMVPLVIDKIYRKRIYHNCKKTNCSGHPTSKRFFASF